MRKLIPASVLALALLAATPAAAQAAIPQDYHTGQCHVDLNLNTHKVVLGPVDGEVTGTLSNPNNCPLDATNGGFSLTNLQYGYAVGSGLGDFNDVDFTFSNNYYNMDWKPAVGKLTPTTDLEYVANDENQYSIDAKWGKVIIDNAASQTVDVRYQSHIKLSAKRAGKYVTLTTKSTRFAYAGYGGTPSTTYKPRVAIQQQVHGKWKTIKTVQAKTAGVAKVKIKAAKSAKYRAVSQALWYVWPSTSGTVKK